MSVPHCSKCNTDHFNFRKCADTPEGQEAARVAEARKRPHIVRQPLPEGVREWGDRLHTVKRQGENRVVNMDAHRKIGRVIYPDGGEGPKAA